MWKILYVKLSDWVAYRYLVESQIILPYPAFGKPKIKMKTFCLRLEEEKSLYLILLTSFLS